MIGSVMYQIFPERFCNGDKSNNPKNVKFWGSDVDRDCFMGGDLKGIIEKLDYIKDLGADTIYLNPIFQSPSNHKYDTSDYYKIDSCFGTLQDFETLILESHKRKIKIIIDGVFNHTSTEFIAFKDLLINQEKSKYTSWYDIFKYPVDIIDNPPYRACGGASFLPKLNTNNIEVQDYIINVIKYWEGKGIDGIRLDVPFEIHGSLLERIRKETKLYLLGEIWGYGKAYVPKYFNGITNYTLRNLIKKAVVDQCISTEIFIDEWKNIEDMYEDNIYYNVNLAGSHDTKRIYNFCNSEINKEKLFYTFLFLLPGIPLIYYGDEIGMKGENDPYCRGCMDWNRENWNQDIYTHIRKLIRLRKEFDVLKSGKVKIKEFNERTLILTRYNDVQSISFIVNFGFQSEIVNGVVVEPMTSTIIES